MKRALFVVCASCLVAAVPPKTRVEHVAEYLRANPSSAELHIVTADIREAVIALLKDYRRVNAPNSPEEWSRPMDETSRTVLLRLHDSETVDKFIRGIKDWAAGRERVEPARISELSDTRDPSFIPHFTEDFLREDGTEIVRREDGDVGSFEKPPSIDVAINVLKLVAACPQFNETTRKWADTYSDMWNIKQVGVAGFRQVLREWWKENEQFLQADNYQAVTAGRSLPLPAAVAVETTDASPTAPAARPGESTLSAPVASAANPSLSSSALLLTGAAIAVAAFAGLVFFWKRRA